MDIQNIDQFGLQKCANVHPLFVDLLNSKDEIKINSVTKKNNRFLQLLEKSEITDFYQSYKKFKNDFVFSCNPDSHNFTFLQKIEQFQKKIKI